MEDIGPEAVKRQRLDSAGNASIQRMQHPQQQYNQRTAAPTPQPLQLHNSASYGAASLAGPPTYAQVPPSPYENRPLEHQQPHPQQQHQHPQHQQPLPQQPQYGQPGSGYSTPNRDTRPPFPEQGPPHHLRRESGVMSGPARSPDDAHQAQSLPQHPQGPVPAMRPVNSEFGDQSYGPAYGPNPPGHPDMAPVDPAANGPYMNPDPQQPNGSYHAMPMNQQPPNGSHHPHPMSTGPPPGQPLAYAQYAPGMDVPPGTPVYGGPYPAGPPGQQQGVKKNARATQACENCRQRKAKCDEGKPSCGACRENSIECKYKDIPPAKHERAQREMMERYESIQNEEKRINERLEKMESASSRILEMLNEMRGANVATPQIRPASHSINPPTPTDGYPPAKRQRLPAPYYPHRWATSGAVVAGNESLPGGPVMLTHNTGAHRLFRWGKIQDILRGTKIDENYVMKLEEQKGVLHYYGKGQGQDGPEGFHTPAPGSPASPASDDLFSSREIWGTDLGRPYLYEGKFFGGRDDSLGGLTLDGTLNLEPGVMHHLTEKYIEHFHLLHPILSTAHLRTMMDRVWRQANPDAGGNHQNPSFSHNLMRDRDPIRTSNKRKFSADYGGEPGTPGGGRAGGQVQEQPLERRIGTAIVLLVLALGKICEHTDPLPGPAQPVQDVGVPGPTNKNMPAPSLPIKAESPANLDSPMRDAGSSIPSPMSISDRGVPTSSSTSVTANSGATPQEGPAARPMRPGDRNVDVIPGLAYYVRAVEILGVLHGGNEIAHAQAFILAALYCSQTACVLESWAWLQNACRVAKFHVREDYLDAETKRNPDGANIIRFVFYTALQMEGDILAELDVPDSGIAKLHSDRVSAETEIGLPKGVADDNQQISIRLKSMNLMEMFYSYQLSMRTLLNDIQEHLYPKNARNANLEMRQQEQFDEGIKLWRKTLTDSMAWNDDDEPSSEINEARLRAKYYGARYIIHRPSIYHALHEMTVEDWPHGFWSINGTGDGDGVDDSHTTNTLELSTAQQKILNSCKMCVKSAIHSTCAFDGMMFDHGGKRIKQRLIVTNIFGTAHAQFGNMLVLSAVYQSYLSSLIERSKLLQLLRRTIHFLRSLAPISSTLKQDADILDHILRMIKSEANHQATESFVADGQPPRPASAMTTPTVAHPTPMTNMTSSFNSVA